MLPELTGRKLLLQVQQDLVELLPSVFDIDLVNYTLLYVSLSSNQKMSFSIHVQDSDRYTITSNRVVYLWKNQCQATKQQLLQEFIRASASGMTKRAMNVWVEQITAYILELEALQFVTTDKPYHV